MPRNNGNTQKKDKKREWSEQATSSNAYPRKNFKVNFKKNDTKAQKKEKQRRKPPTLNITSAKTKPFFAKQPKDKYGDPYEYKMSRLCANEILKECPSNVRPEQYLCDFVTEQYGIMGWCTRVIIEG